MLRLVVCIVHIAAAHLLLTSDAEFCQRFDVIGIHAGFKQRLKSLSNEAVERHFVMQQNLALVRREVDIERSGRQVQIEHERWIGRERVAAAIAFIDELAESRQVDGSRVEIEILAVGGGATALGVQLRDEAAQTK